MENKEATRKCGTCHKQVAEANFALHETHCRRFLTVCPDCEESVPRDQLDQHRDEQHSQVRCSKCYKKMERCRLTDHEADECVERMQRCQFCELEMPWKQLDEHAKACGSRTELCIDCGRYVTLRDQPKHGSTCSATNSSSGSPPAAGAPPNKSKQTVKCSRCTESFPLEEIEQHELECVLVSGWNLEDSDSEDEGGFFVPQLRSTHNGPSLSDHLSRRPRNDRGDPDEISTCPHCHLALPLLTLRWHKVKCQIHIRLK